MSSQKTDNTEVQSFQESGQLVSLDQFYGAIESANKETSPSFGVVLATASGVFSFLETPQNGKQLERVGPGDSVELTGQLLVSGQMLQIDHLKILRDGKRPQIDLEKLRDSEGHPVRLTGKNLCQCGLKTGSLVHSCRLGHLHHLQTADGKIYHYLPGREGAALFLGGSNHFKMVEIIGRVFPGQFVAVTSSRRLQ